MDVFSKWASLDMFRLALDSWEQVWGYGQSLVGILPHSTFMHLADAFIQMHLSYQFLLSLGIEYLTLALACSTILATGTNSYTLSPYSTLFSCILWSPIFYSFSVSIFLLHTFLLFLILLCLVVRDRAPMVRGPYWICSVYYYYYYYYY